MNSYQIRQKNIAEAKETPYTITLDDKTYIQYPAKSSKFKLQYSDVQDSAAEYTTSDILKQHYPDTFFQHRAPLIAYPDILNELSYSNRIRLVRQYQLYWNTEAPLCDENLLTLFTHYDSCIWKAKDELIQNYELINSLIHTPEIAASIAFNYGPVLNTKLLKTKITKMSRFFMKTNEDGIELHFLPLTIQDVQRRLTTAYQIVLDSFERISQIFGSIPNFTNVEAIITMAFRALFKSEYNGYQIYMSMPQSLTQQLREKICQYVDKIFKSLKQTHTIKKPEQDLHIQSYDSLYQEETAVMLPWDSFLFDESTHNPHYNATKVQHIIALQEKMKMYNVSPQQTYTYKELERLLVSSRLIKNGVQVFDTIDKLKRGCYQIKIDPDADPYTYCIGGNYELPLPEEKKAKEFVNVQELDTDILYNAAIEDIQKTYNESQKQYYTYREPKNKEEKEEVQIIEPTPETDEERRIRHKKGLQHLKEEIEEEKRNGTFYQNDEERPDYVNEDGTYNWEKFEEGIDDLVF